MNVESINEGLVDLSKLNRREKRIYNKLLKDGSGVFVTINLSSKVEAMDSDGQLVKNRTGEVPTLKEVILIALRQPLQSDQNTGLKEKNGRYLLIRKLENVDEVDLSETETKLIAERVGKVHLQVEIVGRVMDLLKLNKE